MSRRKEPAMPAELLDQLLAGSGAAEALDQGGLLDSLKKALARISQRWIEVGGALPMCRARPRDGKLSPSLG